MIRMEETRVEGWEAAIRGMRNPMNSWDKSDSGTDREVNIDTEYGYFVGPNDYDLMIRLRNAGSDHRKFMRMITVTLDITAPLYWWKEFDTYRVGVAPHPTDIEMNSCSTMHKIHEKEFVLDDFSYEHVISDWIDNNVESFVSFGDTLNFDPKVGWSHGKEYNLNSGVLFSPKDILSLTIHSLNACRQAFITTKDKRFWWQMIQLLPTSYNQKRTIALNYEVLLHMYNSRKHHKLDEWRSLCSWIESLPYYRLIIGE